MNYVCSFQLNYFFVVCQSANNFMYAVSILWSPLSFLPNCCCCCLLLFLLLLLLQLLFLLLYLFFYSLIIF